MADLSAEVRIFDPIIPFHTFPVERPGVDSFFPETIITHKTLFQIPTLKPSGTGDLIFSSGMSVNLPRVELGVQIGGLKLGRTSALVTSGGEYGVVLGRNAIDEAFMLGRDEQAKVTSASPMKDDMTALGLELFPLDTSPELREFESVIRATRELYNILLVASGEFPIASVTALNKTIHDELGIPNRLKLRLTYISEGSIWLTLKSGSMTTLGYLAGFFDKSATAKLAEQEAKSQKSQTDAYIAQETRDATAERVIQEQKRLSRENIHKSYEIWRNETAANLKFADKLIAQVGESTVREELKKQKDEAIKALIEQRILPVVQNVPRPFVPEAGKFYLTGPAESAEE